MEHSCPCHVKHKNVAGCLEGEMTTNLFDAVVLNVCMCPCMQLTPGHMHRRSRQHGMCLKGSEADDRVNAETHNQCPFAGRYACNWLQIEEWEVKRMKFLGRMSRQGNHRLKASESGSSNQQHSILMALLTGPMQM